MADDRVPLTSMDREWVAGSVKARFAIFDTRSMKISYEGKVIHTGPLEQFDPEKWLENNNGR